jgi:hypothetical protein
MSEYINDKIKKDLRAQLDFKLKHDLITPIDHSYATQTLETRTHPNLAIREGHGEIFRNLEDIRKKYALREL